MIVKLKCLRILRGNKRQRKDENEDKMGTRIDVLSTQI